MDIVKLSIHGHHGNGERLESFEPLVFDLGCGRQPVANTHLKNVPCQNVVTNLDSALSNGSLAFDSDKAVILVVSTVEGEYTVLVPCKISILIPRCTFFYCRTRIRLPISNSCCCSI
jgi:hypothetical protein